MATAIALTASTAALAAPVATVGFEGAFDLIGPGQTNTQYTEQRFSFTPAGGDALIDTSSCAVGVEYCATGNSSTHLQALNGASVTIRPVNEWFQLHSLDASFLPSPSLSLSGYSFGLLLSGTTLGGGSVSQLLELVESAVLPGDFEFSSYTGAADMTRLTSLTLSACYITGGGCITDAAGLAADFLLPSDLQFSVDNLSMSIPEPSAIWLAALSLGALVATRRRSTR
ncbi:NF038120 family PEP-CTERM protein [Aquabacterium sp. OR-4]|uniref:NF038120 family PEP-CTERM protein n=1 Tax=Aquabacterium sp. OR-4 TaxID=2978127 RepID=UPI0021B3B3BF|nr:NF038120 family PEP-CTERM protein [Aquabacterium sp. OR-4]MDT7834934.1 NF038120 family PEP-CTERM protein [Aquabacterium sp. OR-4]